MLLPEAKLYIDGVVRGAEGGATYEKIGPWTGEVVGIAADASAADVNEAIAAARRAFDTTDWSLNHALRLSLVTKLAPRRYAALLMGSWFLAAVAGNYLVGLSGTFFSRISHALFFSLFLVSSLSAAALLLSLQKPIRRLMAGVS